jgi:hypothetical protein
METKMETPKNLTAVFTDVSYPKVDEKTGEVNEVFVFTVKGSKENLELYAKDQGAYYKVNEAGEPLFWTAYPILGYDNKQGVPLRRSMKSGKWNLDNGKERRARAMAKTIGAGNEFNQRMADRITGALFGDFQTAPQVTIKEEDLKDL